MKLRKFLTIALVLALAISALAGCSSNKPVDNPGDETSTDPIKIGVNYELTGAVAQYGAACLAGIQMAADEVNAAGGVLGRQIQLIIQDNKSESAESMNVATKLAAQDKVSLILGPATSGAFKATAAVAEEYKVPVISCSSTANDVTVDGGVLREWVFRTCYSDDFQGTVMGDFAYSDLAAQTAVILSDRGNDYSQGLAASFKTSFIANGGTIVAEEYFTADDQDFNPVLTSIKARQFDVIYLPAYYETVGPILKQARALGITAPVLGADGYDSSTMLELAGSAAALDNVFFTNHYSSGDTSAEVVAFVTAYEAANNSAPNGFNALGYDLLYFAVDAIERAGTADDTDAIRQALASTVDFKGVTGSLSVDANHDVIKSTVIIEFIEGEQTYRTKAGE